jgi:hypothetical protein
MVTVCITGGVLFTFLTFADFIGEFYHARYTVRSMVYATYAAHVEMILMLTERFVLTDSLIHYSIALLFVFSFCY